MDLSLHFSYAKFSPQGLWNVETLSVEKWGAKFPSTTPVEKFSEFNIGLWRNFRWDSKRKGSYPHKFLLRLLLLP